MQKLNKKTIKEMEKLTNQKGYLVNLQPFTIISTSKEQAGIDAIKIINKGSRHIYIESIEDLEDEARLYK